MLDYNYLQEIIYNIHLNRVIAFHRVKSRAVRADFLSYLTLFWPFINETYGIKRRQVLLLKDVLQSPGN